MDIDQHIVDEQAMPEVRARLHRAYRRLALQTYRRAQALTVMPLVDHVSAATDQKPSSKREAYVQLSMF